MRPKNKLVSPLRYPGSKAALTDYIALLIKDNMLEGSTFYEPYAGSAAISLEMLARGHVKSVVLIEKDPLLYAFWYSVIYHTDELCNMIMDINIDIDTWVSFQHYRESLNPNDYPLVKMAVAALFYNRTNYSGILSAGPIGGMEQNSAYKIDCRFNKSKQIMQIREIAEYKESLSVYHDDAISFLKKNYDKLQNEFSMVYLDPPYYGQGKRLYRYYYEDKEHKQLANFIKGKKYPWLISYDDHPEVRSLYRGSTLQPIYLDYTARISKKGKELLISNVKIPPPEYTDGNIEPAIVIG